MQEVLKSSLVLAQIFTSLVTTKTLKSTDSLENHVIFYFR